MNSNILIALPILIMSVGNMPGMVSCDKNQEGQSYQFHDSAIHSIPIEKRAIVNEKFLVQWYKEQYFKSQIEVRVKKMNFKKGGIEYYEVKLLGDVPNSIDKSYSFIYFSFERLLFLLPFEYNHTYLLENQQMFGGFYRYREYDFYLIFKKQQSKMQPVFDSKKIGEYGLKIAFYRDDECLDYRPDRFTFQYNAETKQIIFLGKVFYFCKGREDRNPETKAPFKTTSVHVRIQYNQGKWDYDNASAYPSW